MSNVYKSMFVVSNPEDSRMIDNNEIIYRKVEEIKAQLHKNPDMAQNFDDGFSPLQAEVVTVLTEDNAQQEEEAVANAFEQAAKMIEDAKSEAQSLLNMAENDAAAITRRAKNEGIEIRKNSQREGYEQGYQEAQAEVQMELERKLNEMNRQEQQLQEEYEQKKRELEPILVETIVNIVNDMVHFVSEGKKDMVFSLIQKALEDMDISNNYIVKVSREDAPFVKAHKEILMQAAGTGTLEIVEDSFLKNGQCMIDTDTGIYDCGLDTQMQGLLEDLRLIAAASKNRV